jgi:hypothetical protein
MNMNFILSEAKDHFVSDRDNRAKPIGYPTGTVTSSDMTRGSAGAPLIANIDPSPSSRLRIKSA